MSASLAARMCAPFESGNIIGVAALFLQETVEAENLALFPDCEAAHIFLGCVLPAAAVEGAGCTDGWLKKVCRRALDKRTPFPI